MKPAITIRRSIHTAVPNGLRHPGNASPAVAIKSLRTPEPPAQRPRPESFEDIYIARQNLPYQITESSPSGDDFLGGGVLAKGRIVWMDRAQPPSAAPQVTVYADNIGVIRVDPRLLGRLH